MKRPTEHTPVQLKKSLPLGRRGRLAQRAGEFSSEQCEQLSEFCAPFSGSASVTIRQTLLVCCGAALHGAFF